jgi:hypothetical protein
MALSKIDVANMVTGAVPVANGGTALTSGFVNGGATPAFFGQKASTQGSIARATFTKVTGMTNNEIDSDSAFDGTTFTVPSGGAGKYYIFAQCYCDYGTAAGSDGEYSIVRIYKNGSTTVGGLLEFPGTTNTTQHTAGASGIIDLSASDTIEMYVYLKDENGGTANAAPTDTVLGGFKLGGV